MSLSPDTYKVQQKLANYCRDGIQIELPGAVTERLPQYRRLVFNIIQDNIESAYPIAFKYLAEDVWNELVYDFFAIHNCQSYQVWKLPKEFMDFVITNKYSEKYNVPYLNDLLRFEWVEMEVYNTADIPYEYGAFNGDIINDQIVFNPEHQLLSLQYPLHMLPPEQALEKEGNYFVLLYREKETGKVQFVDVSVWFAFLIEQIHHNEMSINDLLEMAPEIFGNVSIAELKQSSISFIQTMIEKQFVIAINKPAQ